MESGHIVEWTTEDNFMFRLTSFQDRLLEWVETKPYRKYIHMFIQAPFILRLPTFNFGCDFISPAIVPESSRQRVRYWLLNELNSDLSVSRPHSRLQWGIPVPDDSSQTVCKNIHIST